MNNILNFPKTNNQKILEAIKIFSHDNADIALEAFIKLIDEDCDEAYAFVGAIYEFGGKMVEKDYIKARFYYEQSVERFGAVEAYLGLIRIYYYGLGTSKDCCKVLEYCMILVEDKDDAYANYFIGQLYLDGCCVNKDLIKAKKYFMKAWERGYVFGLTKLGVVEQNIGNNFKGWLLRIKAGFIAYMIAKRKLDDPRIREM